MKPRSMEEKISYRLFWMGFVGLICTAVHLRISQSLPGAGMGGAGKRGQPRCRRV